ncbi:DNA polymerase ligase N-terminal domain-containing protein [Bradyrhizobium sp. TZ2]
MEPQPSLRHFVPEGKAMPNLRAKLETKRDFSKTSEPKGRLRAVQSAVRSFVVQKHAASRLYYDLRLVLDGVFKSCAVMKGPSQEKPCRQSRHPTKRTAALAPDSQTLCKKRKAAEDRSPSFVAPQLCRLVEHPPDGENWVTKSSATATVFKCASMLEQSVSKPAKASTGRVSFRR